MNSASAKFKRASSAPSAEILLTMNQCSNFFRILLPWQISKTSRIRLNINPNLSAHLEVEKDLLKSQRLFSKLSRIQSKSLALSEAQFSHQNIGTNNTMTSWTDLA